MARLKSLVKNLTVNRAVKSHNCKRNKDHRIVAGGKRLRVKEGRSSQHYCPDCALASIRADIERLRQLEQALISEN